MGFVRWAGQPVCPLAGLPVYPLGQLSPLSPAAAGLSPLSSLSRMRPLSRDPNTGLTLKGPQDRLGFRMQDSRCKIQDTGFRM